LFYEDGKRGGEKEPILRFTLFGWVGKGNVLIYRKSRMYHHFCFLRGKGGGNRGQSGRKALFLQISAKKKKDKRAGFRAARKKRRGGEVDLPVLLRKAHITYIERV